MEAKASVGTVEASPIKMEIEDKWNEFIGNLLKTRDAWEKYAEEASGLHRAEYERRHRIIQKLSGRFRKGDFDKVLPFFVSYAMTQGGLDQFKIPNGEILREGGKEDGGK